MSKKKNKQDYYPDEVMKAGPVEKFIFDYFDPYGAIAYLYKSPEQIRKSAEQDWVFGQHLELNPDIHYLYFKDTVLWNELYWDLRNAIGMAWKGSDFIEAWKETGNEEKKLIAETDAQKLLFWCMENDYTLNDLKQMIAEKRILTKQILGTKQDSWMTLKYGL